MAVDKLDVRRRGVRALVERLLRRRVNQAVIAKEVEKRFGFKISPAAISRFWMRSVRPDEQAEAEAYREAHAQARALLEEMKADPTLDAAQIAEIMLANQIVKDRTKLGEADILDLYREQRERKKLALQHRALRLRERAAMKVLERTKASKADSPTGAELAEKIKEIYGMAGPLPATLP